MNPFRGILFSSFLFIAAFFQRQQAEAQGSGTAEAAEYDPFNPAAEAARDPVPVRMMELQLEFITIPHHVLTSLLSDFSVFQNGSRLREKLRELEVKKQASVAASTSILLNAGSRASVDDTLQWYFPDFYEPESVLIGRGTDGNYKLGVVPAMATDFEIKEVGLRVEVSEELKKGEAVDIHSAVSKIQLSISLASYQGDEKYGSGREKTAFAKFQQLRLDQGLTIISGESLFLGIVKPPGSWNADKPAAARVIVMAKPLIKRLSLDGKKLPDLHLPEEPPSPNTVGISEFIELGAGEALRLLRTERTVEDASALRTACAKLIAEGKARVIETTGTGHCGEDRSMAIAARTAANFWMALRCLTARVLNQSLRDGIFTRRLEKKRNQKLLSRK